MKTTPNRPNQPGRIYQTNQPHPPLRPDQVNRPEQPQTMQMAKWVLLPMRLFLGITFIYAGLQKLADPQFFNPAAHGYIGKQIIAFATGSPLHDILIRLVPHAALFGALVAYGEIAIGLGTLLGVLLRPAAFFGILINLLFFLSATWHVYPYFYGSDIVFVFCWLTLLIANPASTGLPSLDLFLVRRVLSPKQQAQFAPLLYLLLGVGEQPRPVPAALDYPQSQNRQSTAKSRPAQQSRYSMAQRTKDTRRNFLLGALTGGATILGLTWLWNTLHVSPQSSYDSALSSTPPPISSTAPSSGTAAVSATAIAQANTVKNNSAVNFTLASNGDPGILVRLNNGQFVAYDATCTHAGCPVDYDPSSQLLVCPCHGAAFDPAKSAAVVQGPANSPLTGVPIHVNSSTGAITVSQ